MNPYTLVTHARMMAQRSWLGAPTQQLLRELADELEMSVTKLRDKEWAHEWAVKQKQAQARERARDYMRDKRAKLKKRK